ncbi:MAG TPA: hypothetical protein VGP79_19035 [Bryobacteraceae bacterium]|jgi:hypothetical protein|nr:hypothetical protein [Bryobacteraceae bacterium]
MAIAAHDGTRATFMVPVNAVVSISEDPREGDRLIDVVWDGAPFLMFTQDLRQRCEPIEEPPQDHLSTWLESG